MGGITYESVALLMRYLFLPLAVFITLYTVYMTIVDSMRASAVRAREAETGVLARLEYTGRRGESMKAYLVKEGTVGSGRTADVRLYARDVEKKHFYYEIENGGLFITPLDGAPMRTEGEEVQGEREIRPGSTFFAGDLEIKYIMLRIQTPPVSPTTKQFYGKILPNVMSRKK